MTEYDTLYVVHSLTGVDSLVGEHDVLTDDVLKEDVLAEDVLNDALTEDVLKDVLAEEVLEDVLLWFSYGPMTHYPDVHNNIRFC